MHIIFAPDLVILPGFPLKAAVPVIGQLAVLPAGPPDIIIGVRLLPAAAFLEPGMLVAGVVHHQVHDNLHAPVMGTLQNLLKSLHAAVFRGNIHIVGDVIPAVRAGRGVQRGKPDAVHPQRFQVVQLLINAPEVSHAVAVAVIEAPGPDLVENQVLVPPRMFHIRHLRAIVPHNDGKVT